MEDNTNSALFTFDQPKGQSSYIKVIGVGGGGGNAVNHMFRQGIEGVDFIVCNTDMKALGASPVPNKIPLGDLGLGAGNKPERARKAAEAKTDDIREAISHNTQMLFITAGMGGGTGTGAAPVIAEIAKSIDLDNDENKKILVVAIVTRPFSFEGKRRRQQAEDGIEELRKHVDSIIVINNDKLLTDGRMPISQSFAKADDVLLTAAKGIAEIITENAYVNRDFQDINTVMEHSGTALMGTGSGKGENRAHDAIEAATTSVLLDDSDIRGAKNVLLYFSYSTEHEMMMDEMQEITDYVLEKTDGTADLIWGAGPDESLGDELKVILIATGFEKSRDADEGTVFDFGRLQDEGVSGKSGSADDVKAADVKIGVPDEEGMVVLKREGSVAAGVVAAAEAVSQTAASRPAEAKTVPDFKPQVEMDAPEVPVIEFEEVAVAAAEPDMVDLQPQAAPAAAEPAKIVEAVASPVRASEDKRIVHVLEDEEEVAEPKGKVRNHVRAGGGEFRTEIDAMVDEEITLVKAGAEPVQAGPAAVFSEAPQPAFPEMPQPVFPPVENIGVSKFRNMDEQSVRTSADRIRCIHDMLRNNPQGADYVQNMSASQMMGEPLFEGSHSSESEASKVSMGADGKMSKNAYLYAHAD